LEGTHTVILEQWATVGGATVVIVGGLAAYFRWLLPIYRRARADVVSGRDALLGRDEIRDSITGKVLAPALPGMGVRMDRNEEQMTAMVDAVAQIAPVLTQLAETHQQLDKHGELIAKALDAAAEDRKAIRENARNIADLRAAYMERIANHIDSAAAFSAIEAVAKQPPKN